MPDDAPPPPSAIRIGMTVHAYDGIRCSPGIVTGHLRSRPDGDVWLDVRGAPGVPPYPDDYWVPSRQPDAGLGQHTWHWSRFCPFDL